MGRFSSFLYQFFFKQGFDNKGDNFCWEIGKDSPSDFPRLRISFNGIKEGKESTENLRFF